ncbi:hypothetical protein [Pedobacter immunditicola]|uniref:hypothetical protein n=1 Tax=Pedobacter immunditicola TaxID=3133440 RepID=UPI00309705ED
MVQRIKNFFSNGWVITIGSGITVIYHTQILNFIYNLIGRTPIIINEFWSGLQHLISSVLNFPIKLWWLIVAFLLIGLIRLLVNLSNNQPVERAVNSSSPGVTITQGGIPFEEYQRLKSQQALDRKLKYVGDKFDGFVWKWDWIYNDLIEQYEVKNITPCCASVDCKNNGLTYVTRNKIGEIFKCVKCGEAYNLKLTDLEVQKKVEAQGKYLLSPYYEHNERRENNQVSNYLMRRPLKED